MGASKRTPTARASILRLTKYITNNEIICNEHLRCGEGKDRKILEMVQAVPINQRCKAREEAFDLVRNNIDLKAYPHGYLAQCTTYVTENTLGCGKIHLFADGKTERCYGIRVPDLELEEKGCESLKTYKHIYYLTLQSVYTFSTQLLENLDVKH